MADMPTVFMLLSGALRDTDVPYVLVCFSTMQPPPIHDACRPISVSGLSLHVSNDAKYAQDHG